MKTAYYTDTDGSEKFELDFSYDEDFIEELKEEFPWAYWDADARRWYVHPSGGNTVEELQHFLEANGFFID